MLFKKKKKKNLIKNEEKIWFQSRAYSGKTVEGSGDLKKRNIMSNSNCNEQVV